MNHLPQAWGRPRDDIYGAYNSSYLAQPHNQSQPISHTQSPVVTGTSVLAVKYSTGVVIAADNLASYGSLARFTDVHRLKPFNRKAVVGFGGDVSDMQYLDRLLMSLDIEEKYANGTDLEGGDTDGTGLMSARNLHTYLSKVMYKRRSDFNPLWNALLVAGLDDDGTPFLASADLLGTTFSAPTLATGFGAHLAQPILRRVVPDEAASKALTKEKAVEAVRECMKVLFYRDARSMNEYSIATVDKDGVELKEDEKLEGRVGRLRIGSEGTERRRFSIHLDMVQGRRYDDSFRSPFGEADVLGCSIDIAFAGAGPNIRRLFAEWIHLYLYRMYTRWCYLNRF